MKPAPDGMMLVWGVGGKWIRWRSLAEDGGLMYGNNNPVRFVDPDGMMSVDELMGMVRQKEIKDFGNQSSELCYSG